MREVLNRQTEKLRQILSEKAPVSERKPRTLESTSEIMQAVARLGTVAFAYWAAKSVIGALKSAKGEADDLATIWRNEGKASRDMEETLRRQDEKDTTQIRQKISADWVERERSKVKLRPKSVRGHWEGNVFIPNTKPDATKRK